MKIKRIIGFVFIVTSVFGMAFSFMQGETKTIEAGAINDYDCDNESGEWHFIINQVRPLPSNPDELDAPGEISVSWANGKTEPVALSETTGSTAHYRTSLYLDSRVTKATAVIYSEWSGKFVLSHGPCEIPTPTETQEPTATKTETEVPTETPTTTQTPTVTNTPKITVTTTGTPVITITITATVTETQEVTPTPTSTESTKTPKVEETPTPPGEEATTTPTEPKAGGNTRNIEEVQTEKQLSFTFDLGIFSLSSLVGLTGAVLLFSKKKTK